MISTSETPHHVNVSVYWLLQPLNTLGDVTTKEYTVSSRFEECIAEEHPVFPS